MAGLEVEAGGRSHCFDEHADRFPRNRFDRPTPPTHGNQLALATEANQRRAMTRVDVAGDADFREGVDRAVHRRFVDPRHEPLCSLGQRRCVDRATELQERLQDGDSRLGHAAAIRTQRLLGFLRRPRATIERWPSLRLHLTTVLDHSSREHRLAAPVFLTELASSGPITGAGAHTTSNRHRFAATGLSGRGPRCRRDAGGGRHPGRRRRRTTCRPARSSNPTAGRGDNSGSCRRNR